MVFTFFVAALLSLFSTGVMSYISMATPIGPWIAPTLVLCGMLIFGFFNVKGASEKLVLTTVAGSIGGILATAFGFSFPTLYFLDPDFFTAFMHHKPYFVATLAGLGLSAGGFGLIVANILEKRLIVEDKLAFPIGTLVNKMIAARTNLAKAYQLVVGFASTTLFCVFQDGLMAMRGVIPKYLVLFSKTNYGLFQIPLIRFDIWPMLWAIGFITGHVIAVPLAVGAIAKIALIDPLNQTNYFYQLSNLEFVLAFCSGMVLYGALLSFISLPKMIRQALRNYKNGAKNSWLSTAEINWIEWAIVALFTLFFLSYFSFSFVAQGYLLLATFACIYQVAVIAGKIGLAPLGRFATFVMVPGMLFFRLDFVQIVFIATFVEIAAGVAADVLFGRKIAHLSGVSRKKVMLFQSFGLLVSCLSVGFVFWHLINTLGLGSDELFAYKAQSRRLLIHAKQFNLYAMAVGAVFSAVLGKLKINPMLVLGGLLMPINISLGLVFGGCLTMLFKEREEWEPLWSGVFAANSIWMILRSVV